MRLFDIIKRFITDPAIRFGYLNRLGFYNHLSDEVFLQREYQAVMGCSLNLKDPKTYNEKLQWLKIYDRKSAYTNMVDKYSVRAFITDTIGEDYLIPLVGGPWKSFDEIDFDSLPERFVLKCTHDSGGLVICRDKRKLDMRDAKKRIEQSLHRNYYQSHREWPYKDVMPQIIAEAYMEDENPTSGLTDYKFFCFSGEPEFLYVSQGLENHATASISFFDLEGKRMPFKRSDYKPVEGDIVLPSNYCEMRSIASKLAHAVDCPFVRIDLYSIYGKTYFSEITFSPCGGMIPFEPKEWDKRLGQKINLPQNR